MGCQRGSENLGLYLRKGVKFNNGDEFSADDVLFTCEQWFNKEIGSSMKGLLSYFGGAQNVEKVNDHQVRLHLDVPNTGVPEHLFHYPALILSRKFEGDFLKQPVGTGPFMQEEQGLITRLDAGALLGYLRRIEDQTAEYGLPVSLSTGPMAGSIGPVTLAGNLVLMHAELMAMIVMAQLIKPGAPAG